MTEPLFTLRSATAADARACQILIPKAAQPGRRLVAVDPQTGLVIGAALLSDRQRAKPPIGPGLDLHVVPTHRRRGVARAMLDRLIVTAIERGAEAVYAMHHADAGSDDEHAWRRLGFTPAETVLEHEASLAEIESRLAPLVERMQRAGWIPQEARIVPLCDADRKAVAELHLATLGGDERDLLRRLQGEGVGAFQQVYSRVLLLQRGDAAETVGCILAHRTSRTSAVVDANIVAESVRGGWANLSLKLEATRGAAALGIETFHYRTFDHYDDTRKFTDAIGGRVVGKKLLMHRPVDRDG